MSESDLNADSHVCIGFIVATAEIERTIAHMEADIAFHQNQMRLFEKLLLEQQAELENLELGDHENCA